MSDALPTMTGYLWENALGVLPLIGLVAVLTKVLPCRPATRHTMWLVCMVWLTLPPILPDPSSVGELASRVTPAIDQYFSGPINESKVSDDEGSSGLAECDVSAAPTEIAGDVDLGDGDLDLVSDAFLPCDDTSPTPPKALKEVAGKSTTPTVRSSARPAIFREPRSSSTTLPAPSRIEVARSAAKENRRAPRPQNDGLSLAGHEDGAPNSTRSVSIPAGAPSPTPEAVVCSTGAVAEPSKSMTKRKPARRQRTEAERAFDELAALGATNPSPTFESEVLVANPSDESAIESIEQGEQLSVVNESRWAGSLRWAASWRTVLMLQTARFVAPCWRIVESAKRWVTGSWQSVVEWFSKLSGVRDAVSRVSAPPSALWLSGTAILLLVAVTRAWRFRTRLEIGGAIPDSLRRTVSKVGRKIGLRRVPTIVVVKNRVSPMIWCGGRATLVMPETLWKELDPAGRHAVVCHELAHLRRYDHVVNWFESIIGCLFWWNPVIWWVRVRLRAEAEDSCDAWVTWLLPEQRRAYAEALLRTKQFVGSGNEPTPVNGIGVTSKHANRLARRIKMVMTESTRPRMSYSGLLLVGMVMLAGWMAVPAQSCPTEEKKENKDCKGTPVAVVSRDGHVIAVTAPMAPTPPVPPAPPSPPMPPMAAMPPMPPIPPAPPATPTPSAFWAAPAVADTAPFGGGRSFEQFMPRAGAVATTAGSPRRAPAGNGNMDERLARLEEQLRQLGERLNEMNGMMDHHRSLMQGQPAPHAHGYGHGHDDDADDEDDEDDADDDDDDEVFARSYSLSPGKLEQLFSLMARQDVPIIVNPDISSGEITVNATEDQHESFEGFVRLIEPTPVKKEKREPREAPTPRPSSSKRTSDAWRGMHEEMARVAEAESMQNEALRAEQLALAEHVKLAEEGAQWREAEIARSHATLEQLASVIGRAADSKAAEQLREYMITRKVDRNGLKDQARALEEQAKAIEAQSKMLYEQAQALQEQADVLDVRAEELRTKESEETQKRSEQMNRESEKLREQAGTTEVQASSLESDSQALYDAASSLLARVDLAGDEM